MFTVAARQHYGEHIAPIAALLPPELDVTLTASYRDTAQARSTHRRNIVRLEHGAGQSYSDRSPHYAGGDDNECVGLFLVPGPHPAARWRARYPQARVEVVGNPRLDDLPARQVGPGPRPVVAFTFHWAGGRVPESGTAFAWQRNGVAEVARHFRVIGTGHPRAQHLPAFYAKQGIDFVPDFADVCRQADVLVADNTSVMFEWAALGRPVVVMNAPWFRRDVHHGLRFWGAARIGPQVDDPEDLVAGVERALTWDEDRRERAVDLVYSYRSGAAQRAADAIMAWAP
jgi:hypothetical protein